MRTITIVVLIATASILCFGQAATPAKPAAAPAKPAAAASPNPTAIIHTTAGDMHCKLFEKETPMTVANFIGLSDGTKEWKNPVSHVPKKGVPLYDGTIFHRIIPNFMIQGGDPAGNGSGDPGYKFRDETVPTILFDRPGRLAMANSGPGTNGSQFFITEVPTPHLNGRHTIFGQCDPAAIELVKTIARMASDPRDNRPFHPVKITHIEIQRGVAVAPKAAPAKAAPAKPAAATKPSAAKKPAQQ
jgi:peptidyl-prolyl cis-trans isomerase A (cyclophilin A)